MCRWCPTSRSWRVGRRSCRRSKCCGGTAAEPICTATAGGSSSISTRCGIINPDVFGKDVTVPSMMTALPGRTAASRPIRAAGPRSDLHPAGCSRSASSRWCRPTPATSATRRRNFGDIEAQRFRAGVLEIVAVALRRARRLIVDLLALVGIAAPDSGTRRDRARLIRRRPSGGVGARALGGSRARSEQRGGPRRWPAGRWRRSRIAAAVCARPAASASGWPTRRTTGDGAC